MADNYQVKNAAGATITIAAAEVSPGVYSNKITPLHAGAVVAVGNPLPVTSVVTSLPALPAGTNNIGDVDVLSLPVLPAGDNNIGNVDVVTLPSLPAGTNNIGDVDVLTLPAIPAGSNNIGKITPQIGGSDVDATNPVPVRGGLTVVSGEFTRPSDTTAYAVGDLVGNSTSAAVPLTLTNCARVNGGSGYIVRAALIADQKSIVPSFKVHVFSVAPTQSNDNAAFRFLYADLAKKVGEFTLSAMSTPADTTNSTASVAYDMNLRIPFVCDAGTRNLLFLFETLTAYTPASAGKYTLFIAIDPN